MIKDSYKEEIIKMCKKFVPDAKVYLFGSRARGTARAGSDIDIALDSGHEINRHLIGKIYEEFEASTIPYSIDIVDLYVVSDEMKQEILGEKILWIS